MKNPFGKSRKPGNAYKVFEGSAMGAPGWRWHVLKVNKSPASAIKDPYASAFCFVTSPFCPDGEYGDTYLNDIPGARAWIAEEAGKAVAA